MVKSKKLPGLFVILVGILILGYPILGEYLNQKHQSELTSIYRAEVAQYEDKTGADGEKAGRKGGKKSKYNKKRCYVTSDGLMGFLEIPSLNVYLGIYDGTGEKVLNKGIGHVKSSAYPTGEKGIHTVLCGHSGLSSAKIFTDLENLDKEDYFFIHVGKETHIYQVDKKQVLLPEEAEARLNKACARKGKKCLVTLVTCTPYGVNSHRLLVRGHRVKTYPGLEILRAEGKKKLDRQSAWKEVYMQGIFMGICVICALLLMSLLKFLLIKRLGPGRKIIKN